MANSALIKSSIAKKVWMSLTGLFLIVFLVVHLAGNLQLFVGGEEGKLAFNAYSKFMTTFPLIKVVSYVLYFSILFHAIDGLLLVRKNRLARPVRYAKNNANANSIWASRNMGLLGTIILVFIVIHMGNFWYKMHWGDIGFDSQGNKDLHEVVLHSFQMGWYTALYVVCMIALGFHLFHGFSSAFQTLGLNHKTYTPIIEKTGYALAIIISALFAAIPIYIYFS